MNTDGETAKWSSSDRDDVDVVLTKGDAGMFDSGFRSVGLGLDDLLAPVLGSQFYGAVSTFGFQDDRCRIGLAQQPETCASDRSSELDLRPPVLIHQPEYHRTSTSSQISPRRCRGFPQCR